MKDRPPRASLRERLARAESAIAALRGKEVDAIVGEGHVSYVRLREAEEALRTSEARYRAIVEDQTELICSWLPDGTLTFANQAWCKYYGRRAESVPGGDFLAAVYPEDRAAVSARIASLRAENPAAAGEHRTVLPDGAVRWQMWTHRGIFAPDGQLREYQSVGRDITQRREAEEEVERLNAELEARVVERTDRLRRLARQLAEAEQAERRRLAQLLHDHLQQLLVGARMLIQTAARAGAEADTLEKADGLLEESLDMARTLAVELSPPILQRAGLAASLRWLCEQMDRFGLRAAMQVTGDPDGRVTEELRLFLFQSVRELLFNVVKHASTDTARLSLSRSPEAVRITVQDEGAGFAGKEDPNGPGFGLFNIREGLYLHGGELEVTSAPGQGTRVTLTVPVNG